MSTGFGPVFKLDPRDRRDVPRAGEMKKPSRGERALTVPSLGMAGSALVRYLDTLGLLFCRLRNGHFENAVLAGGLNRFGIGVVRQ